jgi:hypothetical protein
MRQNVRQFVLKEEQLDLQGHVPNKTAAKLSLGRKKPNTELTYIPSKRREHAKLSNQTIHSRLEMCTKMEPLSN